MSQHRHLQILGTRGIPARHGGFETFAEHLALHLVGRGWRVSVYCQEASKGGEIHETQWRGVRLIHVPSGDDSPLATIRFDWLATVHAARESGLVLTLGYNTAIFFLWYRLRHRVNLVNMDGIEWRRAKWSRPARCWLYCNEYAAGRLASHLIADNPGIAAHLSRWVAPERISMIPYGAPAITSASQAPLDALGLCPGGYVLVVARGEPENSIVEIIRAFVRRPRGCKLVVLGRYVPERVPYHRKVMACASSDVLLPGAIYDLETVEALRFHARLYVHGHQVGGTNPSLVEALGAGNAILAFNNRFNRWVLGEEGAYFRGEDECAAALDRLLDDPSCLETMRLAARRRHQSRFEWDLILDEYQQLLAKWCQPTPDSGT